MKATIVFPSHESDDLSVGGIFIPCFSWQIGKKNYVPHSGFPYYRLGDFDYLLKLVDFRLSGDAFARKVVVVIHPNGHGVQKDIENLFNDIQMNGFEYKAVKLT